MAVPSWVSVAEIASAMVRTLTLQNGYVGTLKFVTDIMQPLTDAIPAPWLYIHPVQNRMETYAQGPAKREAGLIMLEYRALPPKQAGRELKGIIQDLYDDRKWILTTLINSKTLGGVVSIVGTTVDDNFQPEGQLYQMDGGTWYGFKTTISYLGNKISFPLQ
jgi:hypothetical protein